MKIGILIKKLREQNNWSQEELAELLDITQSKVSKLENMKEPKSNLISLLTQLSGISGLSLDVIIKEDFTDKRLLLGKLNKKAEKLTDKQIKKLIELLESLS